ncbi:hypothetical protein MAR_002132 [Mya arenaria]|uniref:Uncharacterized protein n=1 Tax=Mya arenaria TaxID=6604 RepID=A0ABY7FFW8_MYAAR|nr:uncharacterized protein LOC128209246 [Mya arenaria]WAR20294.1 hypothetical protein MAR_002132 [Mya arenaria]
MTMTWVQLKDFQCPSKQCPSKDPLTWVCKADKQNMFINERGKMSCSNGTHSGNVCEWGWKCGSDFHKGQYFKADIEGFTFALSQAVQLTGQMGSEWVASLITELGKQYGK